MAGKPVPVTTTPAVSMFGYRLMLENAALFEESGWVGNVSARAERGNNIIAVSETIWNTRKTPAFEIFTSARVV